MRTIDKVLRALDRDIGIGEAVNGALTVAGLVVIVLGLLAIGGGR